MGGEQDDRAVPLLSQDNAEEPVEEPVALRSAEVEELPPALRDNESVASYEEPIEPSALHSHDYEEAKPVDPNALASEEDHLLPATAGVATSPTKMMGEESNDRGVALLSQENGEEPVEENVFPASTDVAKSPTKAMGGEQDDRAVPLLSQDNAEEPVEEPVALRSAEVEELPPALRDNESVASYEEPIEPSALHSHDYEEAKPVDPNALASEEDHLLPATAGVATSPTKMLGEESNDRGVALLSQENGEEPVEEEVPVTLREEEKRPCAVHREEEDQEPLTSTEEHILPASTNVAKTPTKVMGGEANDRRVPLLSQDNAEEPVEEEIPVSLKEEEKRPKAVHREEENCQPLTSTEEHILPASTSVAKTPTKAMGEERDDRAVALLPQEGTKGPEEEEILPASTDVAKTPTKAMGEERDDQEPIGSPATRSKAVDPKVPEEEEILPCLY
ncbi:hypothetical protein, conserved [Angomonas deanei]|uniref:Uncharacterized protein n=1 Tax=Angomonas deanei TaxID=59799 RepID=A0A7G2CQW9_9TRYP|nr:hypothetical protein, conserved [Angomonas deanei]